MLIRSFACLSLLLLSSGPLFGDEQAGTGYIGALPPAPSINPMGTPTSPQMTYPTGYQAQQPPQPYQTPPSGYSYPTQVNVYQVYPNYPVYPTYGWPNDDDDAEWDRPDRPVRGQNSWNNPGRNNPRPGGRRN